MDGEWMGSGCRGVGKGLEGENGEETVAGMWNKETINNLFNY